MIGKLLLGLCIIIAAVVIVKPEYADRAWEFAMGLLGLLGAICIVSVITVAIIVVGILILILHN